MKSEIERRRHQLPDAERRGRRLVWQIRDRTKGGELIESHATRKEARAALTRLKNESGE